MQAPSSSAGLLLEAATAMDVRSASKASAIEAHARSGAQVRSEFADRLNWLRAAVLGANDGIVSTAGIIFGVAGAAGSSQTLLLAGSAAIAAGAMSMATAEFVSVSSQRDYQTAAIAREKERIAADTDGAVDDLAGLVAERGIDGALAHEVAVQLSRHDAVEAHTRLGLGFEPGQVTHPWHAAAASLCSFVIGGLIPLAALLIGSTRAEVPATAIAALTGLLVTGSLSALLGSAPVVPAAARTVAGGILAMAVTYGVGAAVGAAV